MKEKTQPRESGQILVVLVLALVVLLAFTALAIDGGMVLSNRRFDQNTADAISLAGAQASATEYRGYVLGLGTVPEFTCPSSCPQATDEASIGSLSDPICRAMAKGSVKASQSAITNRPGLDPLPRLNVSLQDQGSTGSNNGIYVECINDVGFKVHVMVTSTTPSSFSHMVFGGALTSTVTSVADVAPMDYMYAGKSIVSLDRSPTDCKAVGGGNYSGIIMEGNFSTELIGGGIHSNSCIETNGASGSVNISGDGTIDYMSTLDGRCDLFTVNGTNPYCPDKTTIPVQPLSLTEPYCAGMTPRTYDKNSGTLSPGVYADYTNITGKGGGADVVTMEPGLYCFENGLRVSKPTGQSTLSLTGTGVTIFMKGGSLIFEGGTNIELTAPKLSDIPTPPYPGMLIWNSDSNTSEMVIIGNATSEVEGTIYARYALIQFGGTSGITDSTVSIIGDTVRLNGNPTLSITYDKSLTGILWPSIGLER